MRKMVVDQFKRPHGALGRLAGWIMTHPLDLNPMATCVLGRA